MKKNLLFAFCFVFLMAFTCFAQNASKHNLRASEGYLYYGYCDNHEPDWTKGIGYDADPVSLKFRQIQVSCNSFFPQLLMRPYVASNIVGVRIAVANKIKKAKVFLKAWYTDKDCLVEKVVDLEKGWNEVFFDKGVTIEKRKPYTIGYEYDNPSQDNHYLMLADGNTKASNVASMVGNNGHDPLSVTSELGCFYQQMIIKGDFPEKYNNVELSNLKIGLVAIDKKIIPFQFTLRNTGLNKIESYSGSVYLNNNKVKDFSGELSVNPLDSINIVENKVEASNGDSLKIVLNTINGKDVFYSLKTRIENVLQYAFERTVLLEEFSTENCSQCPSGIKALNQVLSEDKYKDRFVAISHHVGYKEDRFTLPESHALLALYGEDYTFAPAFTLDRISSLISENNPYPIHKIGSYNQNVKYFDEALTRPSLALVNLETNTDVKNKKVSFKVSGEVIKDHIDLDNCYLNVYVVEDKIISTEQKGTGKQPFELNGVLRQFITPQDGMKMNISKDGTFSYDGSFDIPEQWWSDHLRIVAFLSKKLLPKIQGHSNICEVYNTTQSVVKGFESVDQVDLTSSYRLYLENGSLHVTNNAIIVNVYSLNGQLVSNHSLKDGVYVARLQTPEGLFNVKFVVK